MISLDVGFLAFGFACMVWSVTSAFIGLQSIRRQFSDTQLEGVE